jgi:hypothetical protein
MNRIFTLFMAALFAATTAFGQVTDPMITNWWFNTTGNTYKGILTDVEAVYYTSTNVYVKTSGVPNYYVDGVSANDASDLNATWQIPRTPAPAATPQGIMGGQQGLMLDGTVFFHPGDAQSFMGAGAWNRLAYYFEPDMDVSNGHSTPTNMYHHHFDNLKLHNWDTTKHSPLVGYAWDGYPVYGPFGYSNPNDATSTTKRIRSSYQTYTYTTRTSGPAVGGMYPIGCFIEDWQYVAGSGDLDEHNGRFCKTPEYPAGTYAYFTTVDASFKPYYPYFIGPKFYGTFTPTNLGPTGGSTPVPAGATEYTPPTNEVASLESRVELYPIPVTDNLNIKFKDSTNYIVVVYDVNGKILDKRYINSSTSVSMAHFPYGTYFVEVSDMANSRGYIKRIVKL